MIDVGREKLTFRINSAGISGSGSKLGWLLSSNISMKEREIAERYRWMYSGKEVNVVIDVGQTYL